MKTMFPPGLGCHHNGFVATHAFGHMIYGYTLLVRMNQRVLSKLSKEHKVHIVTKLLWWQPGGHIVFMITYIFCSSCYITYDHTHTHAHTHKHTHTYNIKIKKRKKRYKHININSQTKQSINTIIYKTS